MNLEQLQTFFAAYSPIIMLVVMYLAFHFFLIRPQKVEKARREDMLQHLHKGNKVMTVGGIYGEILELKDNVIDLKVAEQVVIQVARASQSISRRENLLRMNRRRKHPPKSNDDRHLDDEKGASSRGVEGAAQSIPLSASGIQRSHWKAIAETTGFPCRTSCFRLCVSG